MFSTLIYFQTQFSRDHLHIRINDDLVHDLQDSKFPVDDGVNPDLIQKAPNSGHQTRTGGLHQNHSFQAHSHAVSRLAILYGLTNIIYA